jgi:peptidoglycan/LPS O-acetylase OafA/YrhL
MAHLKYRPDIDGLRAVAVLGVIIYHAFPKALPGGFSGVDIFFVISGYLISGILYKGVREGGFSFREFYARRVRRLFPSLITLLLVALVFGKIILLNDEFEQMGKHVAAGTLFVQNMVFWSESGYFDIDATLKPLLHLWSLAVEEQFYIFFPPLLLLFWKRRWPMAPLLWILLAASFIGNIIMSYQAREGDFFVTTYRAWEFLGGSLLAWWHFGKNHDEEVPYGNWISLAGLLVLALGMAFLSQADPYPGWRAILPVTGSLLLIGAGKQSWVNRLFLSHPAIVWIGLISYPLYLFHWPPLAFVHIVKGDHPDLSYILWALGIALALTLTTYYLIEKPIRFSKSRWVVPILSAAFVITGILGVLVWRGVIPASLDPTDLKMSKVQQAVKDRGEGKGLKQIWCKGRTHLYKIGGTGPQTLFFGDSNTEMYAPRIVELLKDNSGASRGALILACGGVPPFPGMSNEERSYCVDLMPKYQDVIANYPQIDRVVISALWTFYFTAESQYLFNGKSLSNKESRTAVLQEFGKMIGDLTANGKKVTVVLSIPVGQELDPRRLYRRHFFSPSEEKGLVLTKEKFLKEYGPLLDQIASLAQANGASVINPVDYLCKDGICIVEDENGPIHYDFGHLRSSFVRDKVKYLDATIAP